MSLSPRRKNPYPMLERSFMLNDSPNLVLVTMRDKFFLMAFCLRNLFLDV